MLNKKFQHTNKRDVEFSNLLRQARKAKGLTQKELAARAGTSRTYISRVETNFMDASYSTLKRIVETGLGGELELAIKL